MKKLLLTITLALLLVSNAQALEISNMYVASGKQYEVMYGMLASGELIYIDRDYYFVSSGIPLDLIGATYIKTANNDKKYVSDSFLSFEVDEEVTVYVGYDVRIQPIASWLLNWGDSGWDLVTNDTIRSIRRLLYVSSLKFELYIGIIFCDLR